MMRISRQDAADLPIHRHRIDTRLRTSQPRGQAPERFFNPQAELVMHGALCCAGRPSGTGSPSRRSRGGHAVSLCGYDRLQGPRIVGVAGEHLVAQRKAVEGHDKGDAHLLAVQAMIAGIAALRLPVTKLPSIRAASSSGLPVPRFYGR
jgi:hypothetical protein